VELAAYVKREFQRLGYHSIDFALVPVNMSDGSRELLLAFAWLLHSEQVVYKFSVNCTTVFADDTASLHDVRNNLTCIIVLLFYNFIM